MLTVIKKKGNRQPFIPEKIKTSIMNASEDTGLKLNHKEAELMSQDVERTLIERHGENGVTSALEIRDLVREVIKNFGYPQVLEAFDQGKKPGSHDPKRHLKELAKHQEEALPEQPAPSEPSEDSTDEFGEMKTEHYKSRDW
ncbi:ATP cone domain protein [anaerobic digester metagenome]